MTVFTWTNVACQLLQLLQCVFITCLRVNLTRSALFFIQQNLNLRCSSVRVTLSINAAHVLDILLRISDLA